PHHDEGELGPTALGIGFDHGSLESMQHVIADADRFRDVLETEPVSRHALEAEVVRLTAHGENEVIVGDWPVGGVDTLPAGIEARHFRHPELGVGLAAQDGAHRAGDLLRLEAGGGELVEERLEEVVVVAIHQHHVDWRLAESARGAQAAESGAHDDHGGSTGRRARRDRHVVAEHRARLGGRGRLGHSDSERISMGVVRSPASVSRIELSALSRTMVGWCRAASSGVIWARRPDTIPPSSCKRSEEHTAELQSRFDLVCRLLLEKKKKQPQPHTTGAFTTKIALPPDSAQTLYHSGDRSTVSSHPHDHSSMRSVQAGGAHVASPPV